VVASLVGGKPATSLSRGLEDGASYANAHLTDWARLGRIARARSAAEVLAIVEASFGQPDGVDAPVAYWSGFAHGVQRVVSSTADTARPYGGGISLRNWGFTQPGSVQYRP
jgi:hypothetical protein